MPKMTGDDYERGRTREWSDETFLRAVEDDEPTGTGEVAAAVGCSHETAYKRLRQLEQNDQVSSKKLGNTRVWTTNE